MTCAPEMLRTEHFGAAILGLGESRPRLSWRLPDGARYQEAFEVEVDQRSHGRTVSADHLLVPWPADPLRSRQRAEWRVRTWTDQGGSPWSEPAWCETGLLELVDWVAALIEPVEIERSAHVLSHEFHLDASVGTARLYATAHGIYECYLNGHRVGDHELTPGFTSYPVRLHVQAYDVTDLVVQGDNRWEVLLSDGWYRGRTGGRQRIDGFGSTLGFLGQLEADGVTVPTGAAWMSATGPLVSADLMAGQVEDHRRRSEDWQPVVVPGTPLGPLAWSPAPPVRRMEELRPVSVTRLGSDRHIVDLGQNINGWLRLSDLGPEGSELTLVHGEALDGSGDVTQDNLLMADDGYHQKPDGPFQVDTVVSVGGVGEAFEPRHTSHGFRYARIAGHSGPLTPDDVTGVVVHTDLRRTGWFRCSDESINRFHDIAEWSFRDNACDIPTDCPQRERAGWTGDWQLFVPTAAFLYDVAGFSLKWLRDVASQQRPDGCVTNIAPDSECWQQDQGDIWKLLQGSSGWGDAVVIVPWELWRAYGDDGVLSELWPSMVGWLDYAATMARTRRHPSREARRPAPLPHEAFLWDGGFHWGEWTEPGVDDMAAELSSDQGSVGTAYLYRSATLAARIGQLLGHQDEAQRFAELAANALGAWRAEYIGPDGTLDSRHAGQPCPRPGFRARAAGAQDARRRRTGGPDPGGRHPCRNGLSGHTVPAARPGRDRASRRGLRAPLPAHAAIVAGHDRPRRHHGVGILGGRGRRGPGPRLPQPLQQGGRRLVPASLCGRDPADGRGARLPPVPGGARSPGRRFDLGRGGARLAVRPDRILLAPPR